MMEEIPDWREKKELLWGDKASDEDRTAHGRRFLETRRFSEALDFFSRVKDREGIELVLLEAVEGGDWFLYTRCTAALGEDRLDALRTLAGKAMERGKFLFAFRASKALGDMKGMENALQRFREAFPDSPLLLSQLEEESGLKPEPAEDEGGTADEATKPAKKRDSG